MAKSLSFFPTLLFSFLTLSLTLIPVSRSTNLHSSSKETQDQSLLSFKKEKLTHFRIYWHDLINRSSIPITTPPKNYSSTTAFGLMNMIDNPLTLGPKLSSKLVGRAQGFYAAASEEEVGLLMAMNFAFMDGKYNGSTITVFGRNPVFEKVREMPVIGGSGLFRFARGYVQARTHEFDSKTRNAVVEYSCYVLHY